MRNVYCHIYVRNMHTSLILNHIVQTNSLIDQNYQLILKEVKLLCYKYTKHLIVIFNTNLIFLLIIKLK